LNENKTELTIHIQQAEEEDERLELSTQQLREELLDLNLDSVDFVKSGNAPNGSKAGEEVITWGSLLVSFAASGGILPSLISTLQSWLSRRDNQTISMEIGGDKLEVTGLSSEEQNKLIEVWITRHKEASSNAR